MLLTCEHGGNRVPARYAALFAGAARLLTSHRGFDPGALHAARLLARACAAPLVAATVTRLLVDLNRSARHPRLLSRRSAALDPAARHALLAAHYAPHRRRVLAALGSLLPSRGAVLHVGVHSFTPRMAGRRRHADIGLLYDPARPAEAHLARAWQRALRALCPGLRVRRNYPYHGASDGLTTALRRLLPPGRYVGLELEINQAWPRRGGPRWAALERALAQSLQQARAHA